jgi:hypothetical protein
VVEGLALQAQSPVQTHVTEKEKKKKKKRTHLNTLTRFLYRVKSMDTQLQSANFPEIWENSLTFQH